MTVAAQAIVGQTLAGSYHARLEALTLCPVCGGAAAPSGRVPNLRRFACGSAFGYSKITMAIEPADPCPVPSRIQANQLSAEAVEAAMAYRPQDKSCLLYTSDAADD